MLIKWIKCLVESRNKNLFSDAQEQWHSLKDSEGFIVQTGGWNIHNDNEACIMSLWKDYPSYLRFMVNRHDNIVRKNGQGDTYVSIAVALYDSMFNFNHLKIDVEAIVGKSKIIRSTECSTIAGNEEKYIQSQNVVWGPAMTGVEGFSGGYFSKRIEIESDSDFLVLTYWDSEKSHLDFIRDRLQSLRVKAGMEKYMEKLIPRIIRTEESWSVY